MTQKGRPALLYRFGGIWAGLNPQKQTTYIISLTIGTDVITCAGHVGAVPCLGTDAKPPLRRSSKSFRMRSYANCPILHYFGANKSFRIRLYRHPACNPFRIRSYKHPGGWRGPSASTLSAFNFRLSTVANRLAFSGLWSLLHLF